MTPYEALTEDDKETILNYIHCIGNGDLLEDRLETFLSSWNAAKSSLFRVFGNKLRLERPVVYNAPKKEMKDKVKKIVDKHSYSLVRPMYQTIIKTIPFEERVVFDIKWDYLFQSTSLVDNEFPYYAWQPKALDIRTPQGNRVRIAAGAKTMRLIGKLARAFGFEKEYEQFRIEVSQALNVAHLEGNLCLSIHPMDFMTMSDNDCDWHSCMSWYNDGEYKLGTLEMLGSSYCVVAYLTSEKPYRFSYYDDRNNTWANKKWRQLIFADPAFIVGNRHYPFDAPDVEKIAMKWMKELAEAAHFGDYCDETVELNNNQTNKELFSQPFSFALQMKEMYNDLGRNNYYLSKHFEEDFQDSWCGRKFVVNLSGEARCIDCGCVIDYTPDPRFLLCDSCLEGFECSCCGEFIVGSPEYTNSEGQEFCYYCIEDSDYVQICDICDEYYTEGSLWNIDIDAPDGETLSTVCTCYNCKTSREIKSLFGDFNGSRTFQAESVTEEGHYVLANRYKDFDFEDLLEHMIYEEEEEEND